MLVASDSTGAYCGSALLNSYVIMTKSRESYYQRASLVVKEAFSFTCCETFVRQTCLVV